MIRGTLVPKPRCGGCGSLVDPDQGEKMHVCVQDESGKWVATSAAAAHEERVKRDEEAQKERGQSTPAGE